MPPNLTGKIHIDQEFAESFAADWIASWNAHDLNRVLAHYADDFEMSSPKIIQIANEPSGTLRGKTAVSAYWTQALQLIPDLHFELLSTLIGVNSITLYYTKAPTATSPQKSFILALIKKSFGHSLITPDNTSILLHYDYGCTLSQALHDKIKFSQPTTSSKP